MSRSASKNGAMTAPFPTPSSYLEALQQERARQKQATTRVGDAERNEVVELLGSHFAAGRLDHAEFERRANTALTAVTRRDLGQLLHDLPAAPAPQPTPPKPHSSLSRSALATFLALGLIMGIPVLLLMLLGSLMFGAHVTAFSLFGGGLAMFCGFAMTYLIMNREL